MTSARPHACEPPQETPAGSSSPVAAPEPRDPTPTGTSSTVGDIRTGSTQRDSIERDSTEAEGGAKAEGGAEQRTGWVSDRQPAQRLAAVAHTALALVSADTVTDLLTVIAEQGLSAIGADGGAVAVPAPDDPRVLLSYITTNYGPSVQAGYGHLNIHDPLPVCQAYTSTQPVLLPDRDTSCAYSPQMADVVASTGRHAWACIPLRAGEEVIGVLTAGWQDPQSFDTDQLSLLDTFAAQCAQALHRLRAHEAERQATARQAALVAVAQALGDVHDEAGVLAVVAAHGASLLQADGAGLCLPQPGGTHVRVVTEAYDADVRSQLQHLPADFPLPAIATAVTGTAFFHTDRAQTLTLHPGAEALYVAGNVEASAAVALRAQGRLLGCFSVSFARPHAWSPSERELLGAFATLIAQALARISAHDAEVAASAEIARFSETLQRSLLTSPPEPDHLHIAVRYSPAAEQAQVGGDWYDAFLTADGATSLVIGDVTGHDRIAAAAMGQLRNLLRGIAYAVGDPPAEVLTILDHAIHDLAVDTSATAVLARVEQTPEQRRAGERMLRWSNAGHLPPLLITPTTTTDSATDATNPSADAVSNPSAHAVTDTPDVTVSYLEGVSDLMLGIDPEATRQDHEVVLAPGSTLLLYTDGLIERRDSSLQVGMDWLAATVAGLAHLPVDDLLDELLARVGEQVEDDVALLAVRAYPEDQPRPVEAGPGDDPRVTAARQR